MRNDAQVQQAVSPSHPAESPQSAPPASGRRWRIWYVVMAVVLVALVAVVAGILIGRATKAGEEMGPARLWQSLPPAPIAGRLGPGAVWTGTEMIVWGGYARSEDVGQASDGAAYDPATRAWRTIARTPSGVQGDGGAGVVWTGDAMVVWASNSPDGPVGGAVYEPAADSWRRLPAGPLGIREGYSSVWTGTELIVVGGARGDTLATPVAAAVDPQTGTWRLLPALNRLTGLLPGGVVWQGREAFVFGQVHAASGAVRELRPIFVAYDPATDALREIDLAKAPIAPQQQLALIAWSGTEVVFSTVGLANGRILIVRYNPTTGGWSRGSFAPIAEPTGGYTQTAWLGDRYVAADGSSGLQIYSLDTDTWRTISPGSSPLNSREGSAIVWTGADLIAWSGTVYERYNPTPADGASLALQD